MKPLLSDWAWQQQGNCVGTDPELFFLPDNARQGYKSKLERAAKRVCGGCPVIAECLAHALSVPEKVGVWGGLTADERLLLGAANE